MSFLLGGSRARFAGPLLAVGLFLTSTSSAGAQSFAVQHVRVFDGNEVRTGMTVVVSLKRLAERGVPVLAGSDPPNAGTAFGASVHRELELMVAAGLSPIAALRAATSVPARVFDLNDRGRIAPGLRADLLLVEGDPTSDIVATRNIARIWKQGVPFDREAYRKALVKEEQEIQKIRRR